MTLKKIFAYHNIFPFQTKFSSNLFISLKISEIEDAQIRWDLVYILIIIINSFAIIFQRMFLDTHPKLVAYHMLLHSNKGHD